MLPRRSPPIVVIGAIAGTRSSLNVDSGLFRPLRFFAFFTILSNGFAAILWLWLAAPGGASGREPRTSSAERRPSTSW